MAQETMMSIYMRTLNNCKFYQKKEMKSSLLNEIGVLRGVTYCLELAGFNIYDLPEFIEFIGIQNKLTELDRDRMLNNIMKGAVHHDEI